MDEIRVPVNRRTVVLRMLPALAIYALMGFAWIRVIVNASNFGRLLFVILTLPVFVLAVRSFGPLVGLLFRRSGLVMRTDGLVDYTTGLGFVPWSNIAGVEKTRFAGLHSVSITLIDFEPFLRNQGVVSRAVWRIAKGTKPNIVTSFLRDADATYELLRARVAAV